jgi:aryl-alcohol dehydrogenase-like predicted oxidoreductase
MLTRQLGAKGPLVSALGYGCMGFSQSFGPSGPRDESISVIRRAHELGVTFFDTAESYGLDNHNEILVGEAIAPVRDSVTLATKFGIYRGDGGSMYVDSSADRMRTALENSLRNLRTDHVDLWYQHRVDPATPIEEVASTVKQFVQEGKVLHFGMSEASAATIRRAHAVHPVTAVQSEYSLWFREPEEEVLPMCEELGIGFVPFSPLGRGFLTGTIDRDTKFDPTDFRNALPRFAEESRAANEALVNLLHAIADDLGATTGQIALAWLLSRRPWIVPIPGTRKTDRLVENVGGAAVELSTGDIARIEEAYASVHVVGERYPEALRKMTGL